MAKAINKATKAEVKNTLNTTKEIKMESKKVMKATPEATKVDFTPMRKLFNTVLPKNKGLSLVENKHGAIQVKRDGDVLFSARSNGRMIISHPIMDGKVRVFKHAGDKFDDRSDVPFAKVTVKMLEDRIKDPKSQADYTKQFYGKTPENSGVFQKAEAARSRVSKLKKETGTKKAEAKVAIKEMKKVKETKILPKVVAKAIRKVAKSAA